MPTNYKDREAYKLIRETLEHSLRETVFSHIETMQSVLEMKRTSLDGRSFYSGRHSDHLKDIGFIDALGYTTKDSEAIAKKITAIASRIYNID